MKKRISCGVLCLFFFYANAQEVDLDTINISVPSLRNENLGGQKNTLTTETSLSSVLDKQTTVFIKNYGPGSLSTSSIRGGSAGHTLVLWNGLPIQNPFLGLLDLSLLDTWGMDEVSLLKGGNSAMWGSGAVGGVINLEQKNAIDEPSHIRARTTIGSFGRWEQRARLALKGSKLRSVSNVSYLQSRNNFPYSLTNGDIRTQSSAGQKQASIHQDIYWTPDGSNEIAFHYWRTRADREIPPTTVQNRSEATQFDGADRLSLHWKKFWNRSALRTRVAYYIEDLNYWDASQNIESNTHFETALADADYEIKMANHHAFSIGFSHFRTLVQSPANYERDAVENKSALFARYRYRFLQLSLRQEVVNSGVIPLVPAIESGFKVFPHLHLAAKVSRNYRLPTLNDRFWVPGGNPDLLPESGWSQELSITFKKPKNTYGWTSKIRIGGFNRTLNNWIQWTQEGPRNINKVWSRGIETEAQLRLNRERWVFQVNAAYDYVKSTSQKALSFPTINAGDQLFYTPVHQAVMRGSVDYSGLSMKYVHRFTGATLGINDDLDAFSVADMIVGYQWNDLLLELRVNNLWDEQYRVIERRPMPGRNYTLTIDYTLNKE